MDLTYNFDKIFNKTIDKIKTGDGIQMDAARAQQIIESDQVIEVLHEGSPVWIEKVMDNNMAHVSYIHTKEEKDVPLYMLVEKELPKNFH